MSDNDPEQITSELRKASDRQAVADPIHRFLPMLDEKTLNEDAAQILHEDISLATLDGSVRGRDGVIAGVRLNEFVRTHHVLSNVLVTVDADRAQARANLIVTYAPESTDENARVALGNGGRLVTHLMRGERDRFETVRTHDGWRISSINMLPVWTSEPVPAGARFIGVPS
jgi:hypothetical protein